MMRIANALAAILCVSLLAGCGGKAACKKSVGSDPAAPCQNLTTSDDAGAVGTPQCYVEAQVCPGKGGFPFCERPIAQSYRDSLEVTNTGEKVLTIYSVVARGDTACAFIEPELRDPDGGVPLNINPQETILFSFRFAPPNTGRFNALVEFTSNAENFPVLRIPLCGIGVPADAGVNPVDDGGVQQCGMLMCDDVSAADPTACGPGWVALVGTGT
jgi:hypothetical protein